MKNLAIFITLVAVILSVTTQAMSEENSRVISLETYKDKMTAAWIGQMAGVGWGAPTEFRFNGRIIPESEFPEWKPETINQFQQDDIYVEMTFLKTLEDYGWDVSPSKQALILPTANTNCGTPIKPDAQTCETA